MHEWFDRITNWIVYWTSAAGIAISQLTIEQWYFLTSILLGVAAFIVNLWHKCVMQRIASTQGEAHEEPS